MRRFAMIGLIITAAWSTQALAQRVEPYKWKSVAIVSGGFVTGIVTHPTEKDLIYIRTDIGGAYRWGAPEQRWIALTDWIDANISGFSVQNVIGELLLREPGDRLGAPWERGVGLLSADHEINIIQRGERRKSKRLSR